ncbi:MAG: DUF885 family protein [Alphaproteobacteria bacterium]|nr:DUF885 family protein [Alphaproteobacteria bacterium]
MAATRREFLSSTVLAGAALAGGQSRAFAAPADDLNALFDRLFQESLRESPEAATRLGLDTGANADLAGRLSDYSAAGVARSKALNEDQLRRLLAFNPAALGEADRVNYDTVVYTKQSQARLDAFNFSGASGSGPSPYVISQLSGVYQTFPDFMDTKHRLENAADADAYLARLEGFAVQLDDNTAQLGHDSALGVIPPDFLLDLALTQLDKTRVPAEQNVMVTSLARRAKEKGLSDSYAAGAARIYGDKIVPALTRQISAVAAARRGARHESRPAALRDWPAYYAASLHYYTTTNMTPQQIHQLGLDQVAAISARLDGLLAAQSLTRGTVGERMTALNADARYQYPNTDAGKAEAIAYCNNRLEAVRPRLPEVFKRLPTYRFEVRRVPPATEAGAASAFSQAPSLDGSRPGLVYFNLHDSAEWPKFALATTVFHEGLPGHQLEGGLALTNSSLPLIRKVSGFSGYAEGWGLYAEQLADEIGMYQGDPLGQIGYLNFQLFRAARLVVDTGMFAMGWGREQAIAYFVATQGAAPGFAAREVERYCVLPGQACSYKLGHTIWVRARDRAKAALGARYDIKDFHEAGLNCGRVPLDILDAVIDRYIKARAA